MQQTKLLTDRLAGIGAAYGTAKSGIGIAGVGTFRPDLIMKVSNAALLRLNCVAVPFSTADPGAGPRCSA